MKYILYWNEQIVDLEEGQDFAQTLQVNDIGEGLDSRQSNYTSRVKASFTAKNRAIFKHLGVVGNSSRVPYIHNKVRLYDESGNCLIYTGFGRVNSTSNGYQISLYDGIIDFYNRIVNKNLTEIGISDLNHLKNLDTIISSFENDLPYMYIIADYNGKTFFDNGLNIDYLVPSARIPYLWNRIHEFAGFTFEGSTFATEKFINLFMTYPKPVPILEPVVVAQTTQTSEIVEFPVTYPIEGGGIFYGATYTAKILPDLFDSDHSNNVPGYITIEQTGAFRIKCSGTLENQFGEDGLVQWSLRDSANVVIEEGMIDGAIGQSVIISATATNRLYLIAQRSGSNVPGLFNPLFGMITTTIDFVVGYDANFEEVLVDFSAKEFVNQIMIDFGLTAFKDKYKDHIVYKTLDEILQNPDSLNWSGKFSEKIEESYTLGKYAQRNLFKYKYNGENETHKNGFIAIDDVNIKDEVTIISSKIYAPEKRKQEIFLGLGSKVYKIWNKEVKDNGEINYKDLSGRFYFLRADFQNRLLKLTSENLNTTQTIQGFPLESDFRLHYQQIIIDNYKSIASMLDEARIVKAWFWLTSIDIQNFTFDKLIFVEQESSYFIVNKINNFIRGRRTKVELIEVDYFKELDIPEPEAELTIENISVLECTVTIDCASNIPQPAQVQIIPYTFAPGAVGDSFWQPFVLSSPIVGSLNDNKVIFVCDFLPFSIYGYKFVLKYVDTVFNTVLSNSSEVVDISAECFDSPVIDTGCNPTAVEVTNIARSNAAFPTIYDAGSLWSIQYDLVGLVPDAVCVPYQIRVEINSSLGLQIYNSGNIFSVVGSLVFNLPLRPTTATVRIYFINSDLAEFASSTYTY